MASQITSKLISCNVLGAGQQASMEKYLQADDSPAGIVKALMRVQYDRFDPGAVDRHNTFITFDTSGYSREAMVAAIAGVEKFLKGLHACEVVSDKQYHKYLATIQSRRFTDPLQLLNVLVYDVGYDEYLNPARLLSFADTLQAAGVITAERYSALKDYIKTGGIALHYQLLNYTDHGVYFDLSKYPSDPAALPFIQLNHYTLFNYECSHIAFLVEVTKCFTAYNNIKDIVFPGYFNVCQATQHLYRCSFRVTACQRV